MFVTLCNRGWKFNVHWSISYPFSSPVSPQLIVSKFKQIDQTIYESQYYDKETSVSLSHTQGYSKRQSFFSSMWCLPRSPPGGQVRVKVVSRQGTETATSFLYDDDAGQTKEYHTLCLECWQECGPVNSPAHSNFHGFAEDEFRPQRVFCFTFHGRGWVGYSSHRGQLLKIYVVFPQIITGIIL